MMDVDPIERLFDAFASATAACDVASYRALLARDPESEEWLFTKNSRRIRESKLGLRMQRTKRLRRSAIVVFDVIDGAGRAVDEGELLVVEEEGAWRIRSL